MSVQEQQKKQAAFRLGVRDGMAGTVQAHPPGVGTMHGEYEKGVAEGRARAEMTPVQRAQIILDSLSFVDEGEARTILPQVEKLGHRYVSITIDDDDDKWVSAYETLDDLWDGLADEIQGERTWWPWAVFDLETGRSIPFGVRVQVYESERDGAYYELTTQGVG